MSETEEVVPTQDAGERKPRAERKRMEEPPVPVPQPNDKEFEAKKAASDAEIKHIEKRIEALEADILRLQNKGDASNDPVAKLRAEKERVKARLKSIFTEKDEIQAKIKGFYDQQSMVKDMAKQISGGAAGGGAAVHFKSLEDVDSKIKEMEAEMMTTSLSITEEKKKLQAIQQLQSGKKAIAALTEQRARVSQLKEANEMSREDLRTWQQELKSKTATLNDLREQEKEIDQKIATLRESAPSMQALIDEKRKLTAEKRAKQQDMKAEGDKFYEALRKWKTYDRLKRDWDFQEKRDRIEAQRKEWEEKREIERKLIEQNTVPQHPCAAEIVICVDLESYLKNLLPKEQAKVAQAFVPVATKDDKGKTLKPMGKTANDEGYFSAPAPKEKKGKKAESSVSDKLVYDVHTIGAFAKIKVALPMTKGDIPSCLALVEQARAAFEARTEAEVETEDRQPRARGGAGHADVLPVKVKLTATGPDRVDVKVTVSV